MREILTEAVHRLGEEFWYNVLPVGQFHDPRYGRVCVTPTLVGGLAASFGKATSYPTPVKIGHGDGAASPGVVKEVKAESDGLHVRFEVDEKAAKDVREKRFRFLSAEYDPDYMDKATGKRIGPALLGVALVNQPGHPGVRPIVFSDGEWKQEGDGGMEKRIKELEAELGKVVALAEGLVKERDELEGKLAEESKRAADSVALAEGLVKDLADIRREKREAEVKALCDKAVEQGVPPAFVDTIRPALLSEASGEEISLADGKKTQVGVLLVDLLDKFPKVRLGAAGSQGEPGGVPDVVKRVVGGINKGRGKKE